MFGIIKTIFIGFLSTSAIGSFGESLVSNFRCESLKNQPGLAGPTIVNINCDKKYFLSVYC